MTEKQSIKLVVVGNSLVGKTAMLMSFIKGSFQEKVPGAMETYSSDAFIDGRTVHLTIVDAYSAAEAFDRIRVLFYIDASVFLICYSLQQSESVSSKWVPEVKHHCPKVPIVLCCTQMDLRNNTTLLSTDHGVSLAKQVGAAAYVECSAKEMKGLKTVFNVAVSVALGLKKQKRSLPKKLLGGLKSIAPRTKHKAKPVSEYTLDKLHQDTLARVLRFCELPDFLNLMSSCKRLKLVCDDEIMWRHFCKVYIPSLQIDAIGNGNVNGNETGNMGKSCKDLFHENFPFMLSVPERESTSPYYSAVMLDPK